MGIVHQPDVYAIAAYLGRQFDCKYIVDIGCGRATKVSSLHPEFEIIGLDFGPNIVYCQQKYGFGQWIECDFEREENFYLKPDILNQSILVCADVVEHLSDPTLLLNNFHRWLDFAPAGLLSTPDRDLVRGKEILGHHKTHTIYENGIWARYVTFYVHTL